MIHGRLIGVLVTLSFISAPTVADTFPAVPGQYVVKLHNQKNSSHLSSVGMALGGKIKSTINKSEGLYVVERPVVETSEAALQSLNSSGLVEYAEPNFIYRVVGRSNHTPNDSEFSKLWGLSNVGQVAEGDGGGIQGKAGIDIDALKAWQIETGSKNVLVAVIDTGVNYSHPDLIDNTYTNTAEANGQPGVDDDNNNCVDDIHGCDFAGKDGDPMDVYGHGTHVSGTIGASGDNANGVVGVAWNVTILPVRFLGDDGSGTLEDAIKSIDYATAMGAKIMSNSWGGGGYSKALEESIMRARDAGILFVAAAGNSSNDNDSKAEYPCGYDVDNVISVAAVDPRGALADFSNYGKTSVDVAAPGVNIFSYTMKGLESWSGTSMATPHVSGIAALLWSQDPTQSFVTIKERILNSARPLPLLRNRVAHGFVNAYYALTNSSAPIDPEDPFNWLKSTDSFATPHPYENKSRITQTFTVPGARNVAVYFTNFETESGYDKVVFTDKNGKVYGDLSGRIGETVGPVVDGDTVTITFSSDDSITGFGFEVGGIAYRN